MCRHTPCRCSSGTARTSRSRPTSSTSADRFSTPPRAATRPCVAGSRTAPRRTTAATLPSTSLASPARTPSRARRASTRASIRRARTGLCSSKRPGRSSPPRARAAIATGRRSTLFTSPVDRRPRRCAGTTSPQPTICRQHPSNRRSSAGRSPPRREGATTREARSLRRSRTRTTRRSCSGRPPKCSGRRRTPLPTRASTPLSCSSRRRCNPSW